MDRHGPYDRMREMASAVRFNRFSLQNFRTFTSSAIDVPKTAGRGQWIVLLGNNGSGKSSLLRGLAMALGEPDVITHFLQDTRTGAGFIRRGETSGEVAVSLSAGEFQVRVEPSTTGEKVVYTASGATRPFLVGYGSLRGTGSRQSLERKPADRLASLFIPQAPLLDPQAWLRIAKLQYFESKLGKASGGVERYQKIVECMCRLLPGVKDLDVRSSDVEVVLDDGRRVAFSSLSDGYLTTSAWVLDMIEAWLEQNPDAVRRKTPIAEQMAGIALVDEIDLHLHPIWQRQVIGQIRSVFPNMTFVVTTHSPLTILDVRPGELFVIDQPNLGDPSQIEQTDLRPGDVSDILTGTWFNLSSTVDADTEQKMEQHRQLLAKGGRPSPKVKQLERTIRRRLDGFGASSIDQVVQSVANEVITDSLREIKPAEKARAREALLKLVREKAKK